MTAYEAFEKIYKKPPQYTAFTPYRICPIGAHVDHQLGKITGFAINKGIHIAYGPKENGVIEIQSLQFDKRAQWHVEATPKTKENKNTEKLSVKISLKNIKTKKRKTSALKNKESQKPFMFVLANSP